MPAAVSRPGCQRPPPKAFLMFLSFVVSAFEPITQAPIGQAKPFDKQTVIVS